MTSLTPTLAFFSNFGWQEMIFFGLIGILVFGKRLPEVGRSIGRGIVEFKKGLSGVEDDTDTQVRTPPQIESRPTHPLPPSQSTTTSTIQPDAAAHPAPKHDTHSA